MRGQLGELRKAPRTLWAYVAVSMLQTVAGGLLGNAHLWTVPIGLAIDAIFAFFLLRGSRFMWWLLVVFALATAPFVLAGSPWWWIPVAILQLALLLAPPSRRYVFKPRSRRAPREWQQTCWDPDGHDDATRPPGWYFDPDDAGRMRYWDSELGGWQSKTTRAPRSLRRRAGEAAAD